MQHVAVIRWQLWIDRRRTADVHRVPIGVRIPLIEAVRSKDVAEVRRLLAAAADDQNATDAFGRTALHYGAALNEPRIVSELLAAGTDPNSADRDGFTPLHRAVQQGSTEIVAALMEAGADPSLRSAEGLSAIDLANAQGREDLIRLLERRPP